MLRGLDELNIDDTFLIINVYQDSARELAAIEKLQSQNVSGLIILTANLTEEIRSVIKASKLPTVIQGQDEAEFNRVIMNDIQAGKTVGNYLQKLAPKNVLLLNVDMSLDYAVGHDRFVGIKSALNGMPHKEIITDFKLNIAKQSAYQAMIHEDFDLIIGATDRIVVGAMQSAFALHQKPRYIGFGQSYFSETVSPNLTSFEFSFFEAGKELYRLFRKVRDNNTIQIQRIVIDGKLIIRDSTN